MNYFRFYIGDYFRDTSRLSMLEHAAYVLLLGHYYAEELPIPSDMVEVYTMMRAMTNPDKRAIDKVLSRYFTKEPDGYHNHRADHEIEVSKKARENGKGGGRPLTESITGSVTGLKTKRVTGSITGSITEEGGGSGHPPTTNHQPPAANHQPPAANHQPPENPISPLRGSSEQDSDLLADLEPSEIKTQTAATPKGNGASTIPDCPHQEILALYAKHLPMLTQPRLWDGSREKLLRDRWAQCAKRNDVWDGYLTPEDGLKFWDKFFGIVSKSEVLTDGIPRDNGSSWKPDLPWLLKPENFRKVIDGNYHQP